MFYLPEFDEQMPAVRRLVEEYLEAYLDGNDIDRADFVVFDCPAIDAGYPVDFFIKYNLSAERNTVMSGLLDGNSNHYVRSAGYEFTWEEANDENIN